jgi:AraC family transcriptional regulator of adaptative response/methylated-DNA-[protein]-cysteine methyltransferase
MEARTYRAQGAGEHIRYTTAPAPCSTAASSAPSSGSATSTSSSLGPSSQPSLGHVFVAATDRGVCAVLLGDDTPSLIAELTTRFPKATLAEDPALTPHIQTVLAHLREHPSATTLPLDLRGTAFQARVWAALRTIPRGTTCSYAALATAIGAPKAVRAVARACAQNPAAIVVPCHRVVGSNGKLTGYRWGLARKRTLLALEAYASHSESPQNEPGDTRGDTP